MLRRVGGAATTHPLKRRKHSRLVLLSDRCHPATVLNKADEIDRFDVLLAPYGKTRTGLPGKLATPGNRVAWLT